MPYFPEISRAPLSNLVDLSIFCVISDVDAGQGMIEFLHLAHHVRRLRLRVRSVNGRFFAPFFCEPDQPVLLPCLEELDLRESNFVGHSHILVNMLDSRCHDSDDCVRLTRVWLDAPLDVDLDPSVTRRWKGICEGQLEVSYGGEISQCADMLPPITIDFYHHPDFPKQDVKLRLYSRNLEQRRPDFKGGRGATRQPDNTQGDLKR
ncbi:hypothetical protein ARMGADRAFT_1039557 [Armillaria gallica]|uniref:Uncharacterized protein n=1 Tax=Armillaria gallica TaxID=47427 RepID=A0A2H3CW94_ARMGA|nr:hypothetical protein ARMGADRAFT_1039557 [Armillaria gallica]